MMTLISVAIATAYLYSSAVVFDLTGKMFFWELASLIDIMLLGIGWVCRWSAWDSSTSRAIFAK
jgi:P-type Cu2+ transporter